MKFDCAMDVIVLGLGEHLLCLLPHKSVVRGLTTRKGFGVHAVSVAVRTRNASDAQMSTVAEFGMSTNAAR